jgi:hypothetical protein
MHWSLRGVIAVGLAVACLRAIDAHYLELQGSRQPYPWGTPSFWGTPRAVLDQCLQRWLCILCGRQDAVTNSFSHPFFIASHAVRPGWAYHGLEWVYRLSKAIVYGVPQAVVTLIAYGLLTGFLGPRDRGPGKTTCRKCRHVLRRLSEPRCPECGERI